MPATRSRTAGWRRCLNQICTRRGSIELAVRRDCDGSNSDLLFRARVLGIDDGNIRVETPVTLGQAVGFVSGLELIGIMAIGQNRWMFHTRCIGRDESCGPDGTRGLRLAAPTQVQRCQRRRDYRIDTVDLTLPSVQMWPLLEPATVLPAERLSAVDFQRELDGLAPPGPAPEIDSDLLPSLGPAVDASLVNLGGGGVGTRVGVDDAAAVGRHATWWMRFHLAPWVRTPICVSARIAHRHLRSDRSVYCGMCFEFGSNPAHRQVVSRQIMRAIANMQRHQLAGRKTG